MSKMSGKSSGMSSDLHAGLTNRSPKAPSKKPSGPSVDSEAVRDSTAPNQTGLSGRCA